jgi:pimeloyl-ACP methyl ester carboxylesterase
MCATVLFSAGCDVLAIPYKAWQGDKQPYSNPERLQRGLVVVLPGVEGRSMFNDKICDGINNGGVDWAVELHDWTIMLVGVSQMTEGYNRQKAEEIALYVTRYQLAHPGRPVVLVGQSGGGAMALWIAEAMPPRRQVDGVILLAASISPEYRLDSALLKSRRGVVSFYSPQDFLFLGFGTTVMGTMDGKHASSAGRVGFEVPPGSPPYKKLYQVTWNEEMEKSGFSGGHLSSGDSGFVARFVSPMILRQLGHGLYQRHRQRQEAVERTSLDDNSFPRLY